MRRNYSYKQNKKSKPKCTKDIYCQFLIAAQADFTATGMADGLASSASELVHDSVTRWQKKTKLTPAQFNCGRRGWVVRKSCDLILTWLPLADVLRNEYVGEMNP